MQFDILCVDCTIHKLLFEIEIVSKWFSIRILIILKVCSIGGIIFAFFYLSVT